jgi:hypothetical protein
MSFGNSSGTDLYMTVAYDKGKPVARQGRKAVSLSMRTKAKFSLDFVGEIVWLPKAIGKSQGFNSYTVRQCKHIQIAAFTFSLRTQLL